MVDPDAVLPPGKLPGSLLARLIREYVPDDPAVIVGPGIGRDAAAIQVGDQVIIVKTDPVTFATADAGRYLVNVNANDITCMGAVPRWLLVTALLPERSTTPRLVEELFASLSGAARDLGIALVGGHSEITIGIDRPILVGQMIGEAERSELLDLATAQPGDAILLCNGIAIEGTAILAREASDRLGQLPLEIVQAAARLLEDPGISVVPAARALKVAGVPVRGLHDPTEGGIVTALHELAAGANLGIEIDADNIPVLPETGAICGALGLDPFGLIASGSLLAVLPVESVAGAAESLKSAGIPAAVIGRMTVDPEKRTLIKAGECLELPTFAVDEIARFFSTKG